jgi:hypothetical protein
MKWKYWPILLLAIPTPTFLPAQSIIHGRVVDQTTHEPLESAVVTTHHGKTTLTDQQGNFQLSVQNPRDSLLITFVGYKPACACAKDCCDDPNCCRDGQCRHESITLTRQAVDMKSVTIAPSPNASFHTLGQVDLRLRPVNSPQDLMRLVPGLFLGEHQGGGLAEHIFFRGFDADHGSDVNVSVDGMPVNLVSHIHGQGFADLHFLIPELVSRFDYGKGPYYADHGDFTTAGYVSFHTFDVLDHNEIKLEGGQFNTGRILVKANLLSPQSTLKDQPQSTTQPKPHPQSAWLAAEAAYTNGPFDWAQQLRRLNLFGKYNLQVSTRTRLTATFSTFESGWRSSGEIPSRAVDQHLIGRFGYIDSTQGGKTAKTTVLLKARTGLGNNWSLENLGWYTHYTFTLDYNPTYFAGDSINGDRLRQQERRDEAGYLGRLSHHQYFNNGGDLLSALGWGTRMDRIGLSSLTHVDADKIPLDTLQAGVPRENSANAWIDENYHLGRWLINAGVRLDWLGFEYRDFLNPSLPGRSKLIASPKLNVSYTFSPSLQFYAKTGRGFHSNDAKVVVGNRGMDILPAAWGADVGVNWKPVPRLILNAAVWTLLLQQEFVYNADEGTMEPGNKTRRQGIDLSARYQLTPWLFANLDVNVCKARDLQSPKGQDWLPLAVPFCSTGGLDVKLRNGLSGSIAYRYMEHRPANADNSLVAQGYFVTDMTVNYHWTKWELGLDIQNLLNTKWRETQFETFSRLRHEPAPVDDISYTPGTPFFAKLKLGFFW